jgi:putative acetyltransferase
MTDTLHIRCESPDQPAVRALLDGLDRYLASLYPPEANYILDLQSLLAPEVSFFVARQAGRVVGTGAVLRRPAEPATGGLPYCEIKRMVVEPALRGQGIGARVLAAIEDTMRAERLCLALLETGRDQIEAVRLYERAGYTRRGAFGGYPDNGLSVFYGRVLP